MNSIKKLKAFTMVEILVWILIVSIILVAWFSSYVRIWFWKINLIEQTNIQKNSFFFSERLYQLIKEWWTIDYEEYFNRKVLWTGSLNGHFEKKTGFWNFWYFWEVWTSNFWEWYYYCVSKDWEKLWSDWCVEDFNIWTPKIWELESQDLNVVYIWNQQRYGQYSFQFIDYNSNADDDNWDENWDWNIIWDDDDEYLWAWPKVFELWENAVELYLISWDKKTRTFIRWKKTQDKDAPVTILCETDDEWCIWTIEFIRLEWEDWWLDHEPNTWDSWEFDWVIDTWLLDKQFSNWKTIVAGSVDMDEYWQALFPSTVNVSDFKAYVYPNIDYNNAWKNTDEDSFISPYVILNYKMKPSWTTKKRLKTSWKETIINTTINLTDIFSK